MMLSYIVFLCVVQGAGATTQISQPYGDKRVSTVTSEGFVHTSADFGLATATNEEVIGGRGTCQTKYSDLNDKLVTWAYDKWVEEKSGQKDRWDFFEENYAQRKKEKRKAIKDRHAVDIAARGKIDVWFRSKAEAGRPNIKVCDSLTPCGEEDMRKSIQRAEQEILNKVKNCEPGKKIKSGAPVCAQTNLNNKAECAKFCREENCVAFDFSENSGCDSCRCGYELQSEDAPGREYCELGPWIGCCEGGSIYPGTTLKDRTCEYYHKTARTDIRFFPMQHWIDCWDGWSFDEKSSGKKVYRQNFLLEPNDEDSLMGGCCRLDKRTQDVATIPVVPKKAHDGCADDAAWHHKNRGPDFDCAWVAQKPDTRCSVNGVVAPSVGAVSVGAVVVARDACAAACGGCDVVSVSAKDKALSAHEKARSTPTETQQDGAKKECCRCPEGNVPVENKDECKEVTKKLQLIWDGEEDEGERNWADRCPGCLRTVGEKAVNWNINTKGTCKSEEQVLVCKPNAS